MDEKKLNDEIISCRGAVRKAKVAVIRKIIKKMKILKSCKLEAVKEKKLRKSERLFQKVQIMKKLKDDEVTKFALRNKDLEVFLKGPELDLKLNALASLAKHNAVVKKVNSIKEQFSNWEEELPLLLDSLEKSEKDFVNDEKITSKSKGTNKKEMCKVKKTETAKKSKLKIKPKVELEKSNRDSEQESESERVIKNISHIEEKVEKIEDPFFIEKKVIAPKLVLESLSDKKSDKIEFSRKSILKKDGRMLGKKFKVKDDFSKIKTQKRVTKMKEEEEEKLHPSWAAKKVKLIKPFQGKKIMFSED